MILEGFPHPLHERDLFMKERARSEHVRDIHGNWFYREPLDLPRETLLAVHGVVSNPGSFSPLEGLKMCGGFHADYALAWMDGTQKKITMICFGCGEAKTFGGIATHHVDLTAAAQVELHRLLDGKRGQRPIQ